MNAPETTHKMRRAVRPSSPGLTLASIVAGVTFAFSTVAWSQAAEWTIYDTSNSGLPYNGVTALAIDAHGTIWVGTGRWWAHTGGGLAKFDGTTWTVYNTSNSGLPDNDHVSLSVDPDGSIWSGTENGLSKFDGVSWTVYKTHNSGMLSNQCGAPVFDAEGNAWLLCGALAKFDGTAWTVYHTGNSGLPNNFVTGVDFDNYGNVWAGTFGSGVARFDGQNWTVYNRGNSNVPHNDISQLRADGRGNVWIGTYGGGLAKFDGVAWTPYTSANSGLPHDWIWNFSIDPRGSVWAGTRAGLAKFDGVHWTVYNMSNSGLPDNNAYCAAFGAQGEIWVGTQDAGLAMFRLRPILDFNGNGSVDINDLVRLIESWGQDDPLCDIGPTVFGDGTVDAADLEVLMNYWGQEVQDDTLMAHWKLDETESMIASDSAGQNDGTVIGVPAWQPAGGAVDGALEFDGTTFVVADSVLNPSDGPFSVSAWVKGGAPGQAITSQVGGANWLMVDASGALITELKSAGRFGTPLFSDTVVTDGPWHRLGFTWDGATRSLYVDDVLVAQDTDTGLADGLGGLNIGCGKNMTPDTFFTGLIDDVRIYNRAVKP